MMGAREPTHVHDQAHGHAHSHAHAHEHQHHHGHGHWSAPARILAFALVLTACFMVVEFVGGFLSGSLALLADAGHMLADAGALALALFAQHWANKPRTERSTFGFWRAEVLAAFVNGIALAVTAILITREAIERWIRPVEIQTTIMLAIAGGGLAVNLLVATILMRGQRESLNVRAAFAHVATDAVGSVAALIAGFGVLFFGMKRLDPALSVLIALLVAYSGWRVLKEATSILLETVPSHLDVPAIETAIRSCPGVTDLHDLHVWRISDRFDALTVHVTIERGAHGVDVCRTVVERLRKDFGLEHVTVQPEAPLPEEVVNVRLSRDGRPVRRVS